MFSILWLSSVYSLLHHLPANPHTTPSTLHDSLSILLYLIITTLLYFFVPLIVRYNPNFTHIRSLPDNPILQYSLFSTPCIIFVYSLLCLRPFLPHMTFFASFKPLVYSSLFTYHRSFLACSSLKSSATPCLQAYSIVRCNLNLAAFDVYNTVITFRSFLAVPTTIHPTRLPSPRSTLSSDLIYSSIITYSSPVRHSNCPLHLAFQPIWSLTKTSILKLSISSTQWMTFAHSLLGPQLSPHTQLPSPLSTFSFVLIYPYIIVHSLSIGHSIRLPCLDFPSIRSFIAISIL